MDISKSTHYRKVAPIFELAIFIATYINNIYDEY